MTAKLTTMVAREGRKIKVRTGGPSISSNALEFECGTVRNVGKYMKDNTCIKIVASTVLQKMGEMMRCITYKNQDGQGDARAVGREKTR